MLGRHSDTRSGTRTSGTVGQIVGRATLLIAVCVAILTGTTACSGDGRQAGNDTAAATADTITRYLQNHVATTGGTTRHQLAEVRQWLAHPSAAYQGSYPAPTVKVLAADGGKIEIAVYEFGRTTALDGKNGGWGIACRRYSVTASAQLVATAFSCPSSLPSTPNIP